MKDNIVRSPFFYVGDKYKLMGQLRELFPKNISTYIEPFAGGGSSFLNTKAQRYIVNDIDHYVIALHQCLSSYAGRQEEFLEKLYSIIDEYGLSCSYRNITVPDELKKKYVKTYYSHFNKEAYAKMKADFNEEEDLVLLYLLLIYGFNHMIRFNASGKFNLPVGNVDFNKNVYNYTLKIKNEETLNINAITEDATAKVRIVGNNNLNNNNVIKIISTNHKIDIFNYGKKAKKINT